MMKIFFIILSFILLISCKNTIQNNQSIGSVSQESIKILTVDEFLSNPAGFVDQQVIVTGMAAHVCRHGGQKLFLLGTLPEKFLRINTGKSIAEFPIDLEGSNIEVKGVVSKFEEEIPEQTGTEESDTSRLEKAYHKDNFYVIVADSYIAKD